VFLVNKAKGFLAIFGKLVNISLPPPNNYKACVFI